jgi:hypothetical protein
MYIFPAAGAAFVPVQFVAVYMMVGMGWGVIAHIDILSI